MRRIKNFLHRAASIMSLFPDRSRRVARPKFLDRSDSEAIANDWIQVGNDLRKAMGQYNAEQDSTNKNQIKSKPHYESSIQSSSKNNKPIWLKTGENILP